MLIYNFFLLLYPIIAKLIAPFNEKVRQWVLGQSQVWEEISALSKGIKQPTIWVHCASYGEFEQGLPIIEKLKLDYPEYQIWLTFFSPSGYLHRKNDSAVDFVSYLPLDSKKNAQRFLDLIKPKLVIFIKYEFWYYYLSEAKKQNIPTLLVAATFRKDQLFFKRYGQFYLKMLDLFSAVLVQDNNSFELLKPLINEQKIKIIGDTRFDRVLTTAQNFQQYDWLSRLTNAPLIIAGSTWNKDHAILSNLTTQFNNLNWMIVPHLVDKKSIEKCCLFFPTAITLSDLLNSDKSAHTFNHPTIIIIDKIGYLRSLYHYATICYVGGGFSEEGIHNVLEPAAFAKPVIWGPHDTKYLEAKGLLESGGGFKIQNEMELSDTLYTLLYDAAAYKNASNHAVNFIQNNAGATQKTIRYIQENRLLTN